MTDHQLRLTAVEEGWTGWELDCTHGDSLRFHYYPNVEGGPGVRQSQCWLQSWWSELGAELLNLTATPALRATLTFPLPVKPSDDWDFDGGTIVRDP